MRGVKIIRSGGVSVGHGYSRSFYAANKPPRLALSRITQIGRRMITEAKMTSAKSEEQWNAVRVRVTFLDFFKKNRHTFGEMTQKSRFR